MKVTGLSIHPLRIPFVERFQHSLKDRASSDTVVVKVHTEQGVVGYGEGLPRPYVTGETVDSLVAHVSEVLWPAIAGLELSADGLFEGLEAHLPFGKADGSVHAHNSARCAVEVALVDATLKEAQTGLADVLPPSISDVTYSGIITSGKPEFAVKRAVQYKRVGINHFKIKVGKGDTVARVQAVREALGPEAVIRIDANAIWTLEQAIDTLKSLEPLNVASCEEPLTARSWSDMAALRTHTTIPLMADESLVTYADAKAMVEHKAIDLFNIRLSKCGGIGPCIALANYARKNGLGFQLGAHVGETAILSAAGRHLAAHWGDARFVEGSYGTLLLTEDVSRTSLRFGHKGKGALLRGVGLGVKVLDDRIERYAQQNREFAL